MDEPELPPQVAYIMLVAFVVLVVASANVWRWAIGKLLWREPLIPAQPRPSVPWGLVDLGVAVFTLFFLSTITVAILVALGGELPRGAEGITLKSQLQMLVAVSVGELVTLAAVVLFLRARFLRPWADLGWGGFSLQTLKYGAAGFVFLAAPVYAIQLVLVQWFPSKHPLIEAVKDDPQPVLFLLSTFVAVVVAPLFEEYFLRVLFQGWLENMAGGDVSPSQIFLGEQKRDKLREQFQSNAAVVDAVVVQDPAATLNQSVSLPLPSEAESPAVFALPADDNPYLATMAPVEKPAPGEPTASENRSVLSLWWPVVVSSLCFALLHGGHGPDPIPLFFLALGLGYLYQRTGSVWPGVIMHACFNGWSMGLLWLYVSGS